MDLGSGDNDPQDKSNAKARLSPTNGTANDTTEVAHQHSSDPARGCTSPLHPVTANGLPRHRSILQHVYGSRALWDGSPAKKKFRRTRVRPSPCATRALPPPAIDVDAESSSAPVPHLLSEGDFFPKDTEAALKQEGKEQR